ncbi:MAG: hypothetical protein IT259_04010, partial [Saprospiraceae bacterium]|nr:hypothetical protein [Saprospiraceae bacterium]
MRLFTCLLFLAAPYFLFAQWQNMNGPYAGGALSYAGNTTYIFAANINGVYRSADLGDTWEDTGKGLSKDHDYFNVQANGADVLISGREAGAFNIVAFLSRDNGDTWTKIPLPFYDAIFYYGVTLAGGKLFAADGNHVWERPLDAGCVWTLNALDTDPNAFYNIVVQDGRLFAFGYKEVAVC